MTDVSLLAGKEVALAGRLLSMTRAEAVERIRRAGARFAEQPGAHTAVLVAGSAASHLTREGGVSRSLELLRELSERGASIRLVDEREFLGLLGAADDREDLSRLYTAEQVSRIVETPLPVVRSWVRRGLLPPTRVAHRLAWFDFEDILTARYLARLAASGVPASLIHKSLAEISRWLPDGERVLARLEAFSTGLRLRLSDGSWVEPTGQRLMDFRDERRFRSGVADFPGSPVGSLFSQAVEAEERGDMEAAAGLYESAAASSPNPEIFFNLGNVLYELGRDAAAAERYLSAIEGDHTFAEAWNNLGNAMVALGRLEDGVHAYEMALSLEPDYPEPHCNLVTALDRLGLFEKALAHRTACQKAYPSPAHLTLLRQPDDGSDDSGAGQGGTR